MGREITTDEWLDEVLFNVIFPPKGEKVAGTINKAKSAIQEHINRQIVEAENLHKGHLERLKLEFDANKAQYVGEPWSESDAADMVNKWLAELTAHQANRNGDK